jgi:hypothetical protein
VGRDEDIKAIIERGRQTRTPTPRWLWIAATVVSAICVTCFTVMVAGERPTPSHPSSHPPSEPIDSRPAAGSGLGIGLAIGVGVGIVIGVSIGRQRRDHSSRNSP